MACETLLPGNPTELLSEGRTNIAKNGQTACVLAQQHEGDVAGQIKNAEQGQNGFASPSPPELSEGHRHSAKDSHAPAADAQPELPGGHWTIANTATQVMPPGNPIDETIAAIRYRHRQRNQVMEQRKRADLSLGSFLRGQLGWQPDKPKAERDRIKQQANDLVEIGEAETMFNELLGATNKKLVRKRAKAALKMNINDPAYQENREIILANIQSRAPIDAVEERATKEMERLAETLSVWASFGEGVRGFGPLSLAVIVGEAGDLTNYATHSKLWKRMGVAVMGDVRQGGLLKSASKADWIAHGYNRKRRSKLFVIGECLWKTSGPYRELYLRRKEFERFKAETAGLTVAPAASIPKKRAAEFISDGHVHKRAQRYIEKRLLRDLWRAWRDCAVGHSTTATAINVVPAAQPIEGRAKPLLPLSEATSRVPSLQPNMAA